LGATDYEVKIILRKRVFLPMFTNTAAQPKKFMRTRITLLLPLVLLVVQPFASAQNYSIDWFTIDGGGGTSSGGQYTLSGTIGQPDAGTLSGGNFTLDGGFWGGVFAVQQVGAPTLQIARMGANVLVSWVPSTPGFVLQVSTNLSVVNWTNSPTAGTNPITLPASAITRFFRLQHP
jgi:hypothetical protein